MFLYQELQDRYRKWLYLPDKDYLAIVYSCFLANRFPGDSVWMFIVAPPGSAKTEILRSFEKSDEAYFVSSLSGSALISGWKEKENAILPKLDKKVLIIKDFSTVLTAPKDTRNRIFAVLRDSYDGFGTAAYATGERKFRAKFGVLAATTDVLEKMRSIQSILGERFLIVRPTLDDRVQAVEKALDNIPNKLQMRQELADISKSSLESINIYYDPINPQVREQIIKLATALADLRTPVLRDYRMRQVMQLPKPENPTRIVQQLTQVYYGAYNLFNRNEVAALGLMRRLVRDSIPETRLAIIDEYGGKRKFQFTRHRPKLGIGNAILLTSFDDLYQLGWMEYITKGNNNKYVFAWYENKKETIRMLRKAETDW